MHLRSKNSTCSLWRDKVRFREKQLYNKLKARFEKRDGVNRVQHNIFSLVVFTEE